MKKIYYVGYYDRIDSNQDREYYLSATNLMDYLVESVDKKEYSVEIVSMSGSVAKKTARGAREKLSQNVFLKKFFSFGRINSFFSRIDVHFLRLQMFLYLLFKVKKDDIIIVYHSLNYAEVLRNLCKIKSIKLILQLCEVYQDVSSDIPEKLKKHEFDLVNVSCGYIFSNKYLQKKYNTDNKPSVLLYGIYKYNQKEKEKFEDGKIHVVYAGTLDPRKGAAAASAAASKLPEDYHVHILGFGSEKQIEDIKLIAENNNKKQGATITYDGLKKGEEFEKFLRKCDIGLATQIPDASFAKTSFPSKVLTYLCNGLAVVSSKYEAIEVSPVSSCVSFYDGQEPEKIANCIMNIVCDDSAKKTLNELDDKFKNELFELTQKIGR